MSTVQQNEGKGQSGKTGLFCFRIDPQLKTSLQRRIRMIAAETSRSTAVVCLEALQTYVDNYGPDRTDPGQSARDAVQKLRGEGD